MSDEAHKLENEAEVITITSLEEAIFIRKLIVGTITVAFNNDYVAFAMNTDIVFVYPNDIARNVINDVFQSSNIVKLISKPLISLKSYLRGIVCRNCQHISAYINEIGGSRMIPEMKQEIMEQDVILSLRDRAAKIALIMMAYKLAADRSLPKQPKQKKSYFNKKRDCYLLYLTAYNDLLSRYGPMKFIDLTRKVREYSYLCQMTLHPALALEGLIKVGALSNDSQTAVISIPDYIPR